MSELRWHLKHRAEAPSAYGEASGCVEEYATDSDGNPCFLIERVTSTNSQGDSVVGWLLCAHYSFTVEPFPCARSEWEPLWECDSIEQARREAETRHANRAVYSFQQ